jgi:hypothetical protein
MAGAARDCVNAPDIARSSLQHLTIILAAVGLGTALPKFTCTNLDCNFRRPD